jgi:hypothetical protein
MTKDELKKHLFSELANVYAVLDGASVRELRMKLYQMSPPYHCLFRGQLTPDVEEVAPYVVGLVPDAAFTEWVLEECFGKHWGVFALSRNSITEMRRHFRSLLTVHDETGKPMIFRFYDPRVMQNYLPTCNAGELQTFFGKVDQYFAEDGDRSLSSFKIEGNDLKRTEIE